MLITKQDLLDVLRANLTRAVAYDAANLAKHEKDQKAAVALFRQRLTEARRWTWDEIKAHNYKAGLSEGGKWVVDPVNGGRTQYHERPTCPMQMAPQFASLITEVERDSRVRFTLHDSGRMSRIYRLATWDPDALKDQAC